MCVFLLWAFTTVSSYPLYNEVTNHLLKSDFQEIDNMFQATSKAELVTRLQGSVSDVTVSGLKDSADPCVQPDLLQIAPVL